MDHELDKVIAWIDDRDAEAEQWLNEAKARGVKAMLPHVDEFRAVHNLEALGDLVASLGTGRAREADPRRWLQTVGRMAAEQGQGG